MADVGSVKVYKNIDMHTSMPIFKYSPNCAFLSRKISKKEKKGKKKKKDHKNDLGKTVKERKKELIPPFYRLSSLEREPLGWALFWGFFVFFRNYPGGPRETPVSNPTET